MKNEDVALRNLKEVLEEKIATTNGVIIVPHIRADLDALGSALAFSHLIKKYKKTCSIFLAESFEETEKATAKILQEVLEKDYSFIKKERISQEETLDKLILLTDVNKFNSIAFQPVIQDNTIIVDHHNVGPDTVPSYFQYINPTMSSTCEIVASLYRLFRLKYDKDIARYLLAGIYLDTRGYTRHIGMNTMNIVGKLTEKLEGNVSQVVSLFSEDFASNKRIFDLIDDAEIISYAVALATGRDNETYKAEDLAKAADRLSGFQGIDAAFVVGQTEEGKVAISARSEGALDVSEVMQQLGGGGNAYSAATKISDSTLENGVKELKKVLLPTFYQKKTESI